jgi:hypothetical protein
MAQVANFKKIDGERLSAHNTTVECGWTIIGNNNEAVLHLRTQGSEVRQNKGQTSQTIQLDRERALELLGILVEFLRHP